jgi:hypothetical protein
VSFSTYLARSDSGTGEYLAPSTEVCCKAPASPSGSQRVLKSVVLSTTSRAMEASLLVTLYSSL